MKRTVLCLSALLALTATAQTEQTAKVSGSVKGFGNNPIVVIQQVGEYAKPDTLSLTPKGAFNKQVKLEKSGTAFLDIYENGERIESINIIMEAGKTLTADVSRDKNGEVKIKFGGDTGAMAEYENASRKLFTLSDTFSEKKLGALVDFNACREYVDAQIATLDKPLSKIKDADFVSQEKLSLTQGRTGHYFNYAIAKQKNGFDMTQDKAFMDYVNAIDMNDTTQMRAIMGYLDWRIAAMPDTTKLPTDAVKLKLVKSVIQNQDVRNKVAGDILTFQFFAQMFGADMSGVLPYIYKEFLEVSTDSAMCDYVSKQLVSIENQKGGKEAYAIPMHTLDGTQTTLRDAVGGDKYTYVDFWATWCGPCKKEIPHFAELAEKYKDAPVRFISISIDQDKSKWEAMLNSDKPAWAQYRIPTESQHLCADVYGITGIPRFMLFDKQGRMLNANAPRPSEEKIIEILNSLK